MRQVIKGSLRCHSVYVQYGTPHRIADVDIAYSKKAWRVGAITFGSRTEMRGIMTSIYTMKSTKKKCVENFNVHFRVM